MNERKRGKEERENWKRRLDESKKYARIFSFGNTIIIMI